MNLKLLVSSQILLSLVLSSCYSPRPYQPDYMVNAAMVCDYDFRTPTLSDDCNYVTGYYYHPGSYHLYWRPVGRPAVVVYDNYRFSSTTTYTAGSSVRLNEPIATSVSGQPVRDKSGNVRTAPKGKDYNKTPLSSNPKQPSSYKPTLATPTTSSPPKTTANNKSNGTQSNGTTGSVKAGSMTKPSGSSSSASGGSSSGSSTTPAKAASPAKTTSPAKSTASSTSKPASSSASPVRSNSSSSFSKPSGSKASSSKSSGSVRGGSFGSSKSSGG